MTGIGREDNNRALNFIILTFFSILTIIFFTQTAEADIISQNAGGSGEIAVTTDQYIEGFFSGIPEEAAVTPPVTPPGGGGGGGGGAVTNISISPTTLNINLALNTTTERTIRVTNNGGTAAVISVSQSNLGNHVILGNTTLTIPAGQTVDLDLVFVALSEPGIFTGTVNIGGVALSVSLNVKTKLLLFDSNIVVLNKDYQVEQGEALRTKVTLIPMGDPERLDVTMLFTIRDYAGRIYLTKSETVLVEKLTDLNRNFDTGTLPAGRYIVGLELKYGDAVAPSSAHFEVMPKKKLGLFGRIVLFLISLILLIGIIILIILIKRRRKEDKEEKNESS